jgi:enoyl-CoA hydratase
MAVRIETQGAVATVVIDRPERKNAVDAQTARDLAEAFRAVEADGKVGAAVLWGAGGTFCAGADLKAIGSEGSRIKPTGDGPMGPSPMRLSKPVIAAVSGYAVAGGIELALWCDRRSVYETWGMELDDALAREYELGKAIIDSGESFEGAARFAGGAGRHGAPAS